MKPMNVTKLGAIVIGSNSTNLIHKGLILLSSHDHSPPTYL